jgi:Siphovirus ReqiPepy6 Gp37-like protein
MELYILDNLLRRTDVVDRFESLIWTERVAAWGDFELITLSSAKNRGLLSPGIKLAQNDSYRVMTIETVEDTTDEEGRALLKVKGRSLEALLEDRIAKKSNANLTIEPNWVLTGTPLEIANEMFDGVCRDGQLHIGDKIPYLQPGSIMPVDTIAPPVDPITWNQPPESLYTALKTISDYYNLGFRLVRNFDLSQLYFDFFTGSDRTTAQTILPPVVFSPELDNLQNTTEFTTIEGAKNVAYVYSEQGFEMVYPLDVDPDIEGFERNVLLVNAPTLEGTPTTEELQAHLIQHGLEGLSQHRGFSAFDGEIDQSSVYKYGVHYHLGDLVELRNADGVANNMRVTEQIFVSDREGDRSYPTLVIYQFINTGSWLSWASNKVWAELGPETWEELP